MKFTNREPQSKSEALQEIGSQSLEKYKFIKLIRYEFYTLVKLNFLYALFWLPLAILFALLPEKYPPLQLKLFLIALFTLPLGPATVGMIKILYDLMTRRPIFLFSDFMDAVKQNWREGLILGLIDFGLSILIFIELPFFYNMMLDDAFGIILFIFSVLFSITVLFSNYYLLVMIPMLDTTFFKKLKNAFLVSMLGMIRNFLILFFSVLIIAPVWLFFPLSIVVLILFVPVLIGLIILYNTWPLIEKWCVDMEAQS